MVALRPARVIRLWLLMLALMVGQMAMLVHGAEHLDGGEPPHVCRLCLAGQNVDGPVPPVASLALVLCQTYTVFPSPCFTETASAPTVIHPARGPPAA